MPTLYAPRETRPLPETVSSSPAQHPWRRVSMLSLLLLTSIGLYIALIALFPREQSFLIVWLLCFAPYAVACAFVFLTKAPEGRWRWIELGLILGGALVFRVMLLPLPPNLSHDSWRYLWDARITLRGYSPYVYTPENSIFNSLHDFIYANSRFRDTPTLYPPGAEGLYVFSYLLAPSNLFFLKGIFVVFDMATCGALAWLLARRQLDPRRAIIYAWCPLPIVEFAIEGHVDVITITLMVLAVLCATSQFRGSRLLLGFLIGLATLTKLYPIFLLVVMMRRKDWALLAVCVLTVIAGYLPYYILGHGNVYGYFSKYASQQGGNAGIIHLLAWQVFHSPHLDFVSIVQRQHDAETVFAVLAALLVILLRLLKNISVEAALLLLSGAVFAISSHIFPWYAVTLLPWIAVLAGPLWTRKRLSGASVAVAAAWYFTCITVTSYFPPFSTTVNWQPYYDYVYYVVLLALTIALLIGFWNEFRRLHRLTLEGLRDATIH
jgi:hypothetical protein